MGRSIDKDSPEYATYRKGYLSGYKVGYAKGRGWQGNPNKRTKANQRKIGIANWVLKGLRWYCSNCGTEFDQAHTDFCCKCGHKMSDEAL